MLVFSFDVESLGLYGEGFAVGAVVFEDGKEVDSMFASCPVDKLDSYTSIKNDDTKCSEETIKWLQANVFPTLSEPKYQSAKEVREAFWGFYRTWKHADVFVADCGAPVEANFLRQCVLDKYQERQWQAPYPLHELGTLLLTVGKDPTAYYNRLENELPAHNPVCDARQSGRLWIENFKADNTKNINSSK